MNQVNLNEIKASKVLEEAKDQLGGIKSILVIGVKNDGSLFLLGETSRMDICVLSQFLNAKVVGYWSGEMESK